MRTTTLSEAIKVQAVLVIIKYQDRMNLEVAPKDSTKAQNKSVIPRKDKTVAKWYVEDALDTLWEHVVDPIREDDWIDVAGEGKDEGKSEQPTEKAGDSLGKNK